MYILAEANEEFEMIYGEVLGIIARQCRFECTTRVLVNRGLLDKRESGMHAHTCPTWKVDLDAKGLL